MSVKTKLATGLMALGLGVTGTALIASPAQAVTVIANPIRYDTPGGTWEKTCRFDEQKLANNRVRLHEVRQRNTGTLWKPCERTGYYKDGYQNGTIYVPWWK